MALKVAPVFLIFLIFPYFLVLGWGALREKSPLSKTPLLGLGSGAFVWPLLTSCGLI
jgi:hypothetical protein